MSAPSLLRRNAWPDGLDTLDARQARRAFPEPTLLTIEGRRAEPLFLCVLLHGKGGHTRLLDPFLGIGSSAVAAKRAGVARFTVFRVLLQERLDRVCGHDPAMITRQPHLVVGSRYSRSAF